MGKGPLRNLTNPLGKICRRLDMARVLTAPRAAKRNPLRSMKWNFPFDHSDDIVAGSRVRLLGMSIVTGPQKIYIRVSLLWLANILQSSHQENGDRLIPPPVERFLERILTIRYMSIAKGSMTLYVPTQLSSKFTWLSSRILGQVVDYLVN